MAMNWNLNDDLRSVTLTVDDRTVTFDAAAVDDILKKLGEFRGAMQPPVATERPLGQQVQAVADPVWRTEPEVMTGATLIHMRDPRFGWLHYMIPKAEAAKLAGIIQAQVAAPQGATDPGQVN